MASGNGSRARFGWLGSAYFLGSFALAFLIIGLAFADDFIAGFNKANTWVMAHAGPGALVWSILVVFFLPGAIVMFVALLWRLRQELEEATVGWWQSATKRLRKKAAHPSDSSEAETPTSRR